MLRDRDLARVHEEARIFLLGWARDDIMSGINLASITCFLQSSFNEQAAASAIKEFYV